MVTEKLRDPLERGENGKQWTFVSSDGVRKELSSFECVLLEMAYRQGYKKVLMELSKRFEGMEHDH